MNKNMSKKTIAISLPYAMSTRDILRTDVFKILKRSGVRIVIISPSSILKKFRDEFGGENIFFEEYIPYKPSLLEILLRYTREMIFLNKHSVKSMLIKREVLKKEAPLKYFFTEAIRLIVGSSNFIYDMARKIDEMTCKVAHYERIFKKYKPLLYFSAYSCSIHEKPIIAAAKRNKIKTVLYIFSWDSVTIKWPMPFVPDYAITCGQILKEEIEHYYGYDGSKIFISGLPQFDIYFSYNGKESRKDFFLKNGLDENKKLIMLATTSWLEYEPDIARILYDAIKNREILPDSQLLIRLYPTDDIKRFASLQNLSDIVIQKAGKDSKLSKDMILNDKWDPDEQDMKHLGSLLKHSDVLITCGSTISINALCFDTPIIHIKFDGYEKNLPYHKSARRFYDYVHQKRFLEPGGVRLAGTSAELIKYINMYLSDKSIDSAGRAATLKQQCGEIDGKAGERMANFLLEKMNE